MVVGVDVSCGCRSRSWRGRRRWSLSFAVAVVVVFAAAAVAAAERPTRVRPAAHVRRLDGSSSSLMTRTSAASDSDDDTAAGVFRLRRRQLIGPGSSPPTCRARCGRCTPCRPVHVAIQPGVGAQWEYYPEVWRCKCGDKLFMP
ncbi:EPIDERMAL PATTERNING FACTOR-like protein 6 [Oryza brachyantha]|uniref:EPIDERMAL PATTERNING FACTOR-like protein 6 n=1 Tax=Oryza brachyantha TaxID=4533 RepID=UPI001ADAD032|nr:EPIDERMAL PATTERNING FACTOR-like protein 6 [Oryza brachyantha]